MKLMLRLFVAVAALLATGGFLFFDDGPQKNPNPTEMFMVSGTIVPFAYPQVIAVYGTNDPSCEVYINWLEVGAAKRPRTYSVEIPVHQAGQEYEAAIPVDAFQKGKCQWGLFIIRMKLYRNGEAPSKIKPDDSEGLQATGFPLVYFPNHALSVKGVRMWEHGPNPPTLRLFAKLFKDQAGTTQFTWFQDRIPGYNQNLFVIPLEERSVRINVVDRNLFPTSQSP